MTNIDNMPIEATHAIALLAGSADGSEENSQARAKARDTLKQYIKTIESTADKQTIEAINTTIEYSKMTLGKVVRYKDDNGEDNKYDMPTVYRIIEDNGIRVFMEVIWHFETFRPQFVAYKRDLTPAFVEHEDVPVPSFIDFDVWQDNSWHNDETASVILSLEDGYNLRLWIYSDAFIEYMNDPDDDPANYSKYVMCIEDKDGHMTQGRPCKTDEEIINAIEEFKSNWRTLKDTEEWS